MLRNCLGLF
ncbi:unnamed protein product [Lathyrus oleraceus]